MRRPHPILLSVPSVLLLAVLAWGCWHDRSNRYLCAAAFLCLGAFSIKGVVDELRDPIQVSLADGSLVLRFSRDRHRTIKVTDIRRADERLGWYQPIPRHYKRYWLLRVGPTGERVAFPENSVATEVRDVLQSISRSHGKRV